VCGSATKATATAAVATALAAAVATTATATATATMAATAAGQAVDAGAGRVRLATGAYGLAVGQVQACKLRGLQGVDVSWQLVAIATSMVLTTPLTNTVGVGAPSIATTFRAWTVARAATLTVATVFKATALALALAFKAAFTLRAMAARWAVLALTRALGARLALTLAATSSLVVANALHHVAACGLGGCGHHIAAGGLACATPQSLATHGDGLGHFAGLGAKTFKQLNWNLLLGEAFDVHHEAFFVQAHQAHRLTAGACAACSANAVHVVFRHVGDFEVDDVR
jgi:hypothetical protein